jgi:hypothetical protein
MGLPPDASTILLSLPASTVSGMYYVPVHIALKIIKIYIHTNHSRFNPKWVSEASQILLRDAYVLPKLLSCEEYCRRDER